MFPIRCPECNSVVSSTERSGEYYCANCGSNIQIDHSRSDTVSAKLDRIAEKLMGLYWYCDYHGFDSSSWSCECKEATHETRYEKIKRLLTRVEKTLDTKPTWRRYHARGDVYSLRELVPRILEIKKWAEEPTGCAVFVEGEDDKVVIDEFLKRLIGVELSNYGVHIFTALGGGGKERAVDSARYVARVGERVNRKIPYLIVLDGDASGWVKTQKEIEIGKLFVLSEKEIDSYLLDPRAIAEVCNVVETEVVKKLKYSKGGGKETLEHVIQSCGVRPSPQVKQLVARHLKAVPGDFIRMLETIRKIRSG